MPKSATYGLSWSTTGKVYETHQHGTQQMLPIDPDQEDERWQEWLVLVPSFAFRGRQGTFTVRKERSKRGQDYWYAYMRGSGKLHKKYLAKGAELTIARLEHVASLLQQEEVMVSPTQPGVPVPEQPQTTSGPEDPANLILATRLSAPGLSSRLIERTHLFERLAGVLHNPLTLISAPAGFGKSTLVSAWLRRRQVRHAWLSLEGGDGEPARFWSYFFAALHTLQPGLCDESLALLRSSQAMHIEMVLTLLLNNLATLKQEIIIVLDDYHLLSQKAIHEALGYLVEHLPGHVHLVIATRTDPPLPLARLRLRGQMLELRAADLRFSGEEISTFLAQTTTSHLTQEELDALEERTEGWVAGLQLAALTLERSSNPAEFIRLFTGNHRYIVDYLVQEVIDQLPQQTQEFLLQTAILDRLQGELCEEVTGRSNGQEMLRWLEQANLFLIPLDDERRWYRYHHLFADMLRQRLLQERREEVSLLHQRACNWYIRQRLPRQAIKHAQAANDMDAIADITERYGLELINTGEAALVIEWLLLMPREQWLERIRFFLFDAWGHTYNQQYTYMAQRLREYLALHRLPEIKEVGIEAFITAIQEHVQEQCPEAVYGRGHGIECIAEMLTLCGMLSLYGLYDVAPYKSKQVSLGLTEHAIALVKDRSHRGRLEQHLGLFYLASGEMVKAQAAYEDALLSSMEDNSTTWVPSIAFILSRILLQSGQVHKAERLMQQTLNWARASDLRLISAATTTSVLGNIYFEWNNLEKARLYLQEAAEMMRRLQWKNVLITVLVKLVRVYKAQGVSAEAEHICQELEELSQSEANSTSLSIQARTDLAQLKLIFAVGKDKDKLRHLLYVEKEGFELDDYVLNISEQSYLNRVRVQQAIGDWEEALPTWKRLHVLYERLGCSSRLNELMRIEALVAQEQGQYERALALIAQVLCQSEREGAMQSFVVDGAPMLQLLLRLREARHKGEYGNHPQCSQAYLNALILMLKQQGGPRQEREQNLIEPLSERELEVLALIAEGCSNREIAALLVIAVSTVKSHVNAIYNKLSAENRAQAIAHAHKLHLLQDV